MEKWLLLLLVLVIAYETAVDILKRKDGQD